MKESISAIREMTAPARRVALTESWRILSDHRVTRNDVQRVSAARVLVALLPESLPYLHRLLLDQRDRWSYEVHFSLFCFLDWALCFPTATRVPQLALAAVEEYLMKVKHQTARAAWMAGDLLGDHWRAKEAVPALVRAARAGTYVVGRLGALHGLAHVLAERSPPLERAAVRAAVRRIARIDISHRVRACARSLLDGSHPCLLGTGRYRYS